MRIVTRSRSSERMPVDSATGCLAERLRRSRKCISELYLKTFSFVVSTEKLKPAQCLDPSIFYEAILNKENSMALRIEIPRKQRSAHGIRSLL